MGSEADADYDGKGAEELKERRAVSQRRKEKRRATDKELESVWIPTAEEVQARRMSAAKTISMKEIRAYLKTLVKLGRDEAARAHRCRQD